MACRIYLATSVRYAFTVLVSMLLGCYISLLHNHSTTVSVAITCTSTAAVKTETETETRTTEMPTEAATTISDAALRKRLSIDKRPKNAKDEIIVRHSLYVGVVTAACFLQTRVLSINGTWGHKAPKLEYFASEGERKHDLPVVSLPGVDDTYPPQEKVFRMWKYIHDNYIDQYNWFLRADDDLYVRIPKLIHFLSQLDPTKDLYIGSPGHGIPEDKKRINLYHNERYCMGGPGVVLSRALLQKLVPHLDECLENVVSYNEDVELGRCISRRLGVQCTWAFEMRKLFTNIIYSKNVSVYNRDGITFHPFKSQESMYHIHQFFLGVDAEDASKSAKQLRTEVKQLKRTIRKRRRPNLFYS